MKNKLLIFLFGILLLVILSNYSSIFDDLILSENGKEESRPGENNVEIEEISSIGNNREQSEVVETTQYDVPDDEKSEILQPQSSHPEYMAMFDEFSERIQGIDLGQMTKSECEYVLMEYVRITAKSEQYQTFGYHLKISDRRDERLQYENMTTDELTSLALNDVTEAMFTLGNRLTGSSNIDEVEAGKDWLFQAAIKGSVFALQRLGSYYLGASVESLKSEQFTTSQEIKNMQLTYDALALKRQGKELPEDVVNNENIMRMVDELWEDIETARDNLSLPPLENYPLLELPLEMDWDNCKGIVV